VILDKLLFDDIEKVWVICWGRVKVTESLPCCKSDKFRKELEWKSICSLKTRFWIPSPHVPVMWPCRNCFNSWNHSFLFVSCITPSIVRMTGKNICNGKFKLQSIATRLHSFIAGLQGIRIQLIILRQKEKVIAYMIRFWYAGPQIIKRSQVMGRVEYLLSSHI
jgi:hypothetical protein